jgi:uncharacterized membrane protein YdbT with pleckstrin-like domain
MSYVDRILETNEHVIYRTNPSRTLLFPAIALGLAAGVILLVATSEPEFQGVGVVAAALLAVFAIIVWVRVWFRRFTTEIAVTNRRIIVKKGFIRRQTIEMNMHKVESVDVDQTLLGRLFNYGDVTIRGTGTTLETISKIDAPLRLRTAVTAGP